MFYCGLVQSRLGAGDYNAGEVRVLHMAVNPENELARLDQEQALERLEAENKALKANMTRLEGGILTVTLHLAGDIRIVSQGP